MDESNAFIHVSDKEKIKALKLVVDADGYLAQRQLLQALNLYKESAEILPDPAIIRKIKKLRKYMKRNGMDLGEDKENQVDYINSGKQVSPDAITTPNNGNKSFRERVNFAVSSGNYPKDSPKSSEIITDHVANIKSENTSIKKQEDFDVIVTENKLLETASDCLPATIPENDDDKKETQHKRDVRHQKPRLSSLDLKPEVPLDNAKSRLSKMAPPPATLDTPSSEKISPNSEDRIRSFKDLRKRMYPHQKEGMKWLARLFGEQKGGILGDDMGLGKTLQVIGYLYKMFEVNEIEHVLIVLPNALILPWQSEITRWAPNLNYATFHGKTRAGRMKLLHKLQREGGILFTTYGLIVTNYEELSKGPDGRQFIWDYVFLDEGHKIKNPTKTQKAAHYIPAHNRIIMTGTPIQNNLVEMWSLFDFVHHGSLLGTIKTFKINYENPITRARQKDASLEEKQLGYTMSLNLQKIIAPYFLRRTKAELMADPDSGLPKLPRKNDIIVWVKMTTDQKKVYESYLRLDEVKELMSSSRSPLVALNILKKICDHLRLLSVRICKALGMLTTEETRKYAENRISHLEDPLEIPEWTRQPGAEEPATSIPTKQSKETDCAATQLTGIPDALLYKESSKLMIVIELLGYLSATGHKCLVFSQSTKMLDIIQQILINLHYRHVRMDGQITKLDQRAEIIRRFETNKDIHIFLLTTQVGGVGLNLTVADRIIIVDPSWNPAIDSQAVDRIYRIGQKKNVIIFRLITCGTVEEKIYIRQLFKLSINRQTTKESKDPFRYFTKQDLKQLFIVDDLSVSETQLQLAQMHANKRVSDEVVDDQIKFLESMDSVFGVSDHDLVFSTEDADQEVKMSNSRLQTMVEKAEKAIREEINEESRANAKKMVPGIQERRPPSVETWTSQPTRLSSPLLNLYDEEEDRDERSEQREVRHRRSNAGPNSVFPTSEGVVVVSDQEMPSSCPNNDDVIILSDVQSDVNDDNSEVILDSEDEHPPHVGHGALSALGKHNDGKAVGDSEATMTTTQDIDPSSISNTAEPPRFHQQSLANITLMRAIADSPLSPRKAGLKNVLVADSPDAFMKSISSGSQCSSDSLSPSNSAKLTVAESDYESDESLKEDAVVVESQDEAEDRGSRKGNVSEVVEDDSREFYSPVFRDVSVVVPNSSTSSGSLLIKDQTVSPAAASQFPNSYETDSMHAARGMQSLTEQLHTNLSLDDSVIICSVKQNARKRRVLSSSDSEAEVNEPHSLSRSSVCTTSSGKKANLSPETDKDSENGGSSRKRTSSSSTSCKGRRRPQLVMSDSSSEEDDQPASASISYSESLGERLQRREAGKAKRFVLSSSEDDNDEVDGSSKTADNSLVVTEELSFCVNPSEPLIQCIKTPPAKMSRSRLSNLEKSLSFASHSDSCSPSAKSLAEKESGPTLKSGVDECDLDSDDSKDGGSSFNDKEKDEEEDSAGDEEDDNSAGDDEEDSAEDEEDSAEDEDEEDSAGDEEEEDSAEDEDSEDDSNNIELPKPSPQKPDLYNQYINASRKAYHAEDYVEALKQALKALHQDSSDIKLQMYALLLRKMSKK